MSLTNYREPDQRGSRRGTRPLGGSKRFVSPERFCRTDDEDRNFFVLEPNGTDRSGWGCHVFCMLVV